jgi:hypothetical protein
VLFIGCTAFNSKDISSSKSISVKKISSSIARIGNLGIYDESGTIAIRGNIFNKEINSFWLQIIWGPTPLNFQAYSEITTPQATPSNQL